MRRLSLWGRVRFRRLNQHLAEFAKPFKPPTAKELKAVVANALGFAKRSRLGTSKGVGGIVHDATHAAAGRRGMVIAPTPKAMKVAARKIDVADRLSESARASGTYYSLSDGTKRMGHAYLIGTGKGKKATLALSARKHLEKSLIGRNYRAESFVAGLQGIKRHDTGIDLVLDLDGNSLRERAYWLGRRARKKKQVPKALMRLQGYTKLNPDKAETAVQKASAVVRGSKRGKYSLKKIKPVGSRRRKGYTRRTRSGKTVQVRGA